MRSLRGEIRLEVGKAPIPFLTGGPPSGPKPATVQLQLDLPTEVDSRVRLLLFFFLGRKGLAKKIHKDENEPKNSHELDLVW